MIGITPEVYIGLPENKRRELVFPIRDLDCDTIIDRVAAIHQIEPSILLSKSRKREIVTPRMIAIYLSLKTGKYTLQGMGKRFKMDHSSIIYCRDTINDLMSVDRIFKKDVADIEDRICKQRATA